VVWQVFDIHRVILIQKIGVNAVQNVPELIFFICSPGYCGALLFVKTIILSFFKFYNPIKIKRSNTLLTNSTVMVTPERKRKIFERNMEIDFYLLFSLFNYSKIKLRLNKL